MTESKPESLLFYVVLACLATAGFFYINIMAAIVDGLIKGLGFTKPQAGLVASFNIYGASVGALVAAIIVPRIDWKRALIALFTALIVVDLVSTQVVTPTPLMLVRALHGLIGGTSVGIGLAVIARTAAPDRAFGVLLVVQFGLGGLGVMLLPGLVPTYGTAILFEVLAALTLVTLVMTVLLPRSRIGVASLRKGAAAVSAGRFTALVTLPAIFLFQAANMALSAFIIGLGEAAGLPSAVVTSALGWATWLGAAGAVAVIVIGARWGRFWPLLAAMSLTLVGTAAFHYSASAAVFFAANVGTAITWSFVIPYLFGMSSQFDASGRMAAWCGLFSKLGLATGPLAAGYVLRGEDYSLLINLSVACLVLAALAAFIPARVLDRAQ